MRKAQHFKRQLLQFDVLYVKIFTNGFQIAIMIVKVNQFFAINPLLLPGPHNVFVYCYYSPSPLLVHSFQLALYSDRQ